MSHATNPPNDPKLQERIEKVEKHDHRIEHIFRRILHVIERIIATITLLALLGALAMEVYHMFLSGAVYFEDVNHMLHNLLTIVVGLEFVRMLVDMTPANTLEVLIVAISRHVILTHDDPWTILVCVVSIAALFATRHFLIPKAELAVEMSEVVEDEGDEEAEEEEESAGVE